MQPRLFFLPSSFLLNLGKIYKRGNLGQIWDVSFFLTFLPFLSPFLPFLFSSIFSSLPLYILSFLTLIHFSERRDKKQCQGFVVSYFIFISLLSLSFSSFSSFFSLLPETFQVSITKQIRRSFQIFSPSDSSQNHWIFRISRSFHGSHHPSASSPSLFGLSSLVSSSAIRNKDLERGGMPSSIYVSSLLFL